MDEDLVVYLEKKIKKLEADRDHWKANHDNQVKPKAAIADRPDLDALHAATTQGEWECRRFAGVTFVEPGMMIDDWQFCCDIHNAWPAISEELKRLRDENKLLKIKSTK